MKHGFGYKDIYIIVLVIGYTLGLPYMVENLFNARGYFAFGGEWLAPLGVVLVLELIRESAIMVIYALENRRK